MGHLISKINETEEEAQEGGDDSAKGCDVSKKTGFPQQQHFLRGSGRARAACPFSVYPQLRTIVTGAMRRSRNSNQLEDDIFQFLPAAKPRRSMGHVWPSGKLYQIGRHRGQRDMGT